MTSRSSENWQGYWLSWSRNKLSEFFQLDDVTVNWKLVESRSSRIISGLIYKPSKIVQIPSLLTIWGSLGRKMLKERVGGSKFEEWSKLRVNNMWQVFGDGKYAVWKKRGLDCEMWVSFVVYSQVYRRGFRFNLFHKIKREYVRADTSWRQEFTCFKGWVKRELM